MRRRNPYPEFNDCDEAWEALLKETSRVELSDVRAFAVERTEYYLRMLSVDEPFFYKHFGRQYETGDFMYRFDGEEDDYEPDYELAELPTAQRIYFAKHLVEFYKRLSVVSTRDELYSCVIEVVRNSASDFLYQELPPWGLMLDFTEITEPFDFVHFVPQPRLQEIRKQGFFGRATPNRLTLTRMIQDFYIKDNGYFFAYPLDPTENFDTDLFVVNFSSYIKGVSSKALIFYFVADGEYQLLIPTKCVTEMSFFEPDQVVEWEASSSEDLPEPQKRVLGSAVVCSKCKLTFEMHVGAVRSKTRTRLLCSICDT